MPQARRLLSKLSYGLPQLRLYVVAEATKNLKMRPILKPHEAAKLLAPLRHAAEEHFVSLHLNAKHELIGLHEVSHGTLSASLVHPREVYKAALLANSFAILVCHNHPSGSTLTPSQEDFATTRQLLAAGNLLGVTLIDHLIVGPTEAFFSFRENHPQLWTA